MMLKEIKCEMCGETFMQKASNQIYCTKKCAYKAKNQRRYIERKKIRLADQEFLQGGRKGVASFREFDEVRKTRKPKVSFKAVFRFMSEHEQKTGMELSYGQAVAIMDGYAKDLKAEYAKRR